MSLIWRVFVINAALVVAATLALAISPATVSSELLVREIVVLAVGVLLVLVLNFALIRRSLRPLERLTDAMHEVDLLHPGGRIEAIGGGSEVTGLTAAFNTMLDRLETERRSSGRVAIQAQEHERHRIALELHDEVGQLLTGVVLGLDGLNRQVPDDARPAVRQMQDMTRQGVDQVREIARGLRPETLEELGLRSALVGLVSNVASASGLRLTRRIMHDVPDLAPDIELVIYRVAQESLTNIVRHAQASTAEVALVEVDGGVELCITDDGRGLPADHGDAGRGLAGMQERALYVGGTLELGSVEPRGTCVRLRVPTETR